MKPRAFHRTRVFWRYLTLGVQSELQYRTNFLFQALQTAVSVGTGLGGIGVVFHHTKALAGWSREELVVLLGVYFVISGAIYSVIQPSLQLLMEDVRRGTLDFVLIKPIDSQFLISVRRLDLWHMTDSVVGVGLILWGLNKIGRGVSWSQLVLFLVMLFCGLVIVYSFWLMLATCSFWFVKVENMLVIFESMYQAGRWPMELYPRIFRSILTFLVPVAFAVSIPAQVLAGRSSAPTILGTLAVSLMFFLVTRAFWIRGARHYSGASA